MLMGIGPYENHIFHSGAFAHIGKETVGRMIEDVNFILTSRIYTDQGKSE